MHNTPKRKAPRWTWILLLAMLVVIWVGALGYTWKAVT